MDPEALRREYASMTDEALLDIDPGELVTAARQCLEEELQRRKIRPERRTAGQEPEAELDLAALAREWADQPTPDWVEEGAIVYAETIGRRDQPRMREAMAVLVEAGISCHTKVFQDPTQDYAGGSITASCELLVPFNQQLQAISVLDKRLFNTQLEADWRAHFETMTDDDLLALEEDSLVGGLRDRADRLLRAWEDELLKRGLAELETSKDESGG